MTPADPKISSRLRRAATAERGELDRHRERLLVRRDQLQAELEQVERALAAIEERDALLNRLAPLARASVQPTTGNDLSQPLNEDSVRGTTAAELLRGTAIRETAVRILAESPDVARPVHYRRLYDMLGEAGFAVGGKDPLATFLTQLSRSPVMRKTTRAGIYELDREAPEQLRHQLAELQIQLRATTASPVATDDLADIRQRREQVLSRVAQTERALEEAARVLGPSPNAAGRGAA